MKVIYCAGEQGRVVLDILRSKEDTADVVFADDDASLHEEQVANKKVIGDLETLGRSDTDPVQCIVAFGDTQGIRLKIAEKIAKEDYEFFNAIHSSATISDRSTLATGLMINGQSYIGPDVEVHSHVLIDSCVNISHGSVLKKGVTITPHVTIAGDVTVHSDAYLGPNATIIEDVSIGKEAVVGAGSTVMDDVPSKTTVVGSPAVPVE
jgi:sugar O-acyltransferase (sialic acid O-acetyltransferase NeuD family)